MKIDAKKMTSRAVDCGRLGFRLALKAGVLYTCFTALGLIFGGIGGYWGGGYLGYGAWVDALCVLGGIAAGGIGGFFLAQIVLVGIIQDMLLGAGIRAGKTGFKAAMKLLRERRGVT